MFTCMLCTRVLEQQQQENNFRNFFSVEPKRWKSAIKAGIKSTAYSYRKIKRLCRILLMTFFCATLKLATDFEIVGLVTFKCRHLISAYVVILNYNYYRWYLFLVVYICWMLIRILSDEKITVMRLPTFSKNKTKIAESFFRVHKFSSNY